MLFLTIGLLALGILFLVLAFTLYDVLDHTQPIFACIGIILLIVGAIMISKI